MIQECFSVRGMMMACLAASWMASTGHAQTWDSGAQFSGVQGQDGWYYRIYTNMLVDSLVWDGEKWSTPSNPPFSTPRQHSSQFVPGSGNTAGQAIVRSWQSVVTGEFTVTGYFSDGNKSSSGDGVEVRIWINSIFDSPLYQNVFPVSNVGYAVEYDLGIIPLSKGNQIHVGVFNNGSGAGDHTNVGMTITRVDCSGDLNGDGVVNAADLADLLGAWGPCDNPAECPADLHGNGDGIVQADDLAFMLDHWGACE